MKKALLDTNFYIHLVDSKAKLHKEAIEYYRYFLANKIIMFLSTVVVGEFCVKSSYGTLPVKDCRILAYNLRHSVEAGRLANPLFANNKIKPISGGRMIISNDVKLLAQTSIESMDYFVSFDGRCQDLVTFLSTNGYLSFDFIDFSKPLTQNSKLMVTSPAHTQYTLFQLNNNP